MKKNKGNKGVMTMLTKAVQNKSSKGIHPNAISKHVCYVEDDSKNKNMRSNLEGKNLDEFLEIAKMSQKQYDVLNEQIVVQSLNTNTNKEILQNQFSGIFLNNTLKNSDIKLYETKPLAIPKRPKWKQGISAMEFEKMERESFLNWRRALAKEEEGNMNYAITPFEKNLEVWRQLWLVVEKCQLLIQIVDGRNPLYFRCPDLEKYIGEVDKKKDYLLLINKADLMSNKVRKSWADYFSENGIKFLFFSALEEAKKIDDEFVTANRPVEESQEEQDDSEEDEEETHNQSNIFNKFKNMDSEDEEEESNIKENEITTEIKTSEEEVKKTEELTTDNQEDQIYDEVEEVEQVQTKAKYEKKEPVIDPLDSDETIRIYDRSQFLSLIKSITSTKVKDVIKDCYNVGFIGYPNVGKSSVINVLMNKKKVGVACMPGKTKHYQSLYLPDDKEILLMDCPGLVFPSFTSSKGDMAVNGIMQIDTLREWHSPISIIIQKIPRTILEIFYKIELPDIYSATQFLQVLAAKRGYITGRSLPDEAKTAKMVLKEYVSGKLLYCNLRPDYNEEVHGEIIPYQEDLANESQKENITTQGEKEKMQLIKEIPADFDDDYEKINIDIDTTRNLKTITQNFDAVYFNDIMTIEDSANANRDKPITKDMKRGLKFAVKRGEITEEEYEEAVTVQDYEDIILRLTKDTRETTKKDMVGAKLINV